MKGLDANTQQYELAEIDNKVVLFTNMRLDRDTILEGIFCYDVRDSDNLDGSMAQIKPFVLVNHWGTILSKEPFPMDESGSYYPEDWGYLGESMNLLEFQKETAEQLKEGATLVRERRQEQSTFYFDRLQLKNIAAKGKVCPLGGVWIMSLRRMQKKSL